MLKMNLDILGWEAANVPPKPFGGGRVDFLKGKISGHVGGDAVLERQAGNSPIATMCAGNLLDGYFTYGLIRRPTK
jgi:hypothetical protein